jgi:hypothetical protein
MQIEVSKMLYVSRKGETEDLIVSTIYKMAQVSIFCLIEHSSFKLHLVMKFILDMMRGGLAFSRI